MDKQFWIFLVGLATLVTCSVADLTTGSDLKKTTIFANDDDTLAAKRFLRSEGTTSNDDSTVANKKNQAFYNIGSEERTMAGRIMDKIFNAIEQFVGPDKTNKLRLEFLNLMHTFIYKMGFLPDDVYALAREQTNVIKRQEFERVAARYQVFFYFKTK